MENKKLLKRLRKLEHTVEELKLSNEIQADWIRELSDTVNVYPRRAWYKRIWNVRPEVKIVILMAIGFVLYACCTWYFLIYLPSQEPVNIP